MPQFAPIEKKIFIALKAQPVKFRYTDLYLAQNADLSQVIFSIMNDADEIKALLKEQSEKVGLEIRRCLENGKINNP